MRTRLLQVVIAGSLTVTGTMGLSAAAGAQEGGGQPAKLVRLQDDCDPQTFNEVLGEGACVGDGGTTFQELFAELEEEGEAGAWRIAPDRFALQQGRSLRVLNQGGETHSFTMVRRFGPGCVPEVNDALGFPEGAMARECRSRAWLRTLRAPGESLRVRGLEPGRHRFACLIHPWMRARVTVQGAND